MRTEEVELQVYVATGALTRANYETLNNKSTASILLSAKYKNLTIRIENCRH